MKWQKKFFKSKLTLKKQILLVRKKLKVKTNIQVVFIAYQLRLI